LAKLKVSSSFSFLNQVLITAMVFFLAGNAFCFYVAKWTIN
jgi:Sec-independent protein secretion pathway component TatC